MDHAARQRRRARPGPVGGPHDGVQIAVALCGLAVIGMAIQYATTRPAVPLPDSHPLRQWWLQSFPHRRQQPAPETSPPTPSDSALPKDNNGHPTTSSGGAKTEEKNTKKTDDSQEPSVLLTTMTPYLPDFPSDPASSSSSADGASDVVSTETENTLSAGQTTQTAQPSGEEATSSSSNAEGEEDADPSTPGILSTETGTDRVTLEEGTEDTEETSSEGEGTSTGRVEESEGTTTNADLTTIDEFAPTTGEEYTTSPTSGTTTRPSRVATLQVLKPSELLQLVIPTNRRLVSFNNVIEQWHQATKIIVNVREGCKLTIVYLNGSEVEYETRVNGHIIDCAGVADAYGTCA